MMTPASPASRREPRVRLDARVHVHGPDDRETVLLASDWSSRGVFLRTREPFIPGTRVSMFMVLGQPARKRIKLTGVVARVVPHTPGSHHVREGMVVAFDEAQPLLKKRLDDLARYKKPTEEEQARSPLTATVVGDDRTALGVERVLRNSQYTVRRIGSAAIAAGVLASEPAPRVLVVCEGCGKALMPIVSAFSSTEPPDLVITIGIGLQELGPAIGAPLIALPASWPPESIATFLDREADAAQPTSDDDASSWLVDSAHDIRSHSGLHAG